ncbi:MAG: hypothetical protein QXT28_11485 [Thermofilaceae archaeon]
MSREAWIPTFNGKGRHLGYLEFAELAGKMPPTLNADFLVYLEDGVVKGKDLRTGKEYGPSPTLSPVLNAIISSTTGPISILIGSGVYPVPDPILLRNRVSIFGAGGESTILETTGGPVFQWMGEDVVRIENLAMRGRYSTGTGILVEGDWDAGETSGFCLFRNIYMGNLDYGLRLSELYTSHAENLFFTDVKYPIYIEERCVNDTFRNVWVWNAEVAIYIGKRKYRCEGLKFESVIVLNSTKELDLRDGFVITFDGCIFDYGKDNNFVHIGGGEWISFRDCWFASQFAPLGRVLVRPDYADTAFISFHNCWFALNKYYGIQTAKSPTTGKKPFGIHLSHCVFRDNGTSTDGGDIFLENTDNVIVEGCELLSINVPFTIAMQGECSQVTIRDCYTVQNLDRFSLLPGTKIERMRGRATEGWGRATIPAGSTSVTVNFYTMWIPKIIKVTPLDDLKGRSFWVSNITGNGFTINISSPDTVDHTFAWEAEVGWV